MDKLYQLDTGWGCGGVTTNENDIIIKTPPIFWKFKGKDINWLTNIYRVEFVCEVESVEMDSEDDFF